MAHILPWAVVKAVGLAGAAVITVELVVTAIIWLAGGRNATGQRVDWEAVAALGAVGSTVATILAVGTLAYASNELETVLTNSADRPKRAA